MSELKEIADRVFATPGRTKGGVCGQAIEAMSRSTFHQISAWDADALYEAAAEITRLRAALDAMTAERGELQLAFYGSEKLRLLEREDTLRYKRIVEDMTAERDAARAAVAFVRNVAQSAMTAEHDQDEREALLDLDTLRFQRDCDITTARDLRAMIEQKEKR